MGSNAWGAGTAAPHVPAGADRARLSGRRRLWGRPPADLRVLSDRGVSATCARLPADAGARGRASRCGSSAERRARPRASSTSISCGSGPEALGATKALERSSQSAPLVVRQSGQRSLRLALVGSIDRAHERVTSLIFFPRIVSTFSANRSGTHPPPRLGMNARAAGPIRTPSTPPPPRSGR